MRRITRLLPLLLLPVLSSHAADRTWLGADGDWFNPSNWSDGSVPGANDVALIPAGIVRIRADVSVAEIRVLGRDGAFVVSDQAVVTAAALSIYRGSGTIQSAQLNLGACVVSGGGRLRVDASTIRARSLEANISDDWAYWTELHIVGGSELHLEDDFVLASRIRLTLGAPNQTTTIIFSGPAARFRTQFSAGNLSVSPSGTVVFRAVDGSVLTFDDGPVIEPRYGTLRLETDPMSRINLTGRYTTLNSDGAIELAGNVQLSGRLEAFSGGSIRVQEPPLNYDPATGRLSGGTWTANLGGTLEFAPTVPIREIASNTIVQLTGGPQDLRAFESLETIAGSIGLRHDLTITPPSGTLAISGRLSINAPGHVRVRGDLRRPSGAGGGLDIGAVYTNKGQSGRLDIEGTLFLDNFGFNYSSQDYPAVYPCGEQITLVFANNISGTAFPTVPGSFCRCYTSVENGGIVATVVPRADFNRNGFVDDEDFGLMVKAYELVQPWNLGLWYTNLNADNIINEADVFLFIQAYEAAICP